MSLPDYEWFWWFEMIFALMGVPILIVLCFCHGFNVIKDIYTSSAKQLIESQLYKSMIILSMISILFYTFSNVLELGFMWNYSRIPSFVNNSDLEHFMKWEIRTGSLLWFIAKQSMYILFLLRLHTGYKSSLYAYNPKRLILIGVISFIVMIINGVNMTYFTHVEAFYYENILFAIHFNSYYPLWVVLICGGSDFIMSLIFIYAFLNPLRKVTRNVGKNNETINGIIELYNKGFKAFVLTAMSTITTLVFLLCILFTTTLLLLPVDSVINCLCIMMITPYYSDKQFYQKLCILPIYCSKYWKGHNAFYPKEIEASNTKTQMSIVNPASVT